MHQLHLFKVLVTPSPFSMVAIVVLSIIWVTISSLLYFSDNQLIYRYIFGADGITTHTWAGTETVAAWTVKFFSSSTGYYVLLVGFGIMAGIAVYTLLQTGSFIIHGTANFLRRAENATQPVALLEIFTQLWIRCLALVGWVLFGAVTISSLLPLVDILISTGASYLKNYNLSAGWFYAQALGMCMVALHMHIVFARLLLLRPRVFGFRDV